MKGRVKRTLGDLFGLKNFGVNLTSLAPGAVSALRHAHSRQDEFLYVLQGTCISRWAIARQGMKEAIPTTISRRCSLRASGGSRTRTENRTDGFGGSRP